MAKQTIDELIIEVGAEVSGLKADFAKVKAELNGMGKNVKKGADSWGTLQKGIAAAMVLAPVVAFGRSVIATIGKFQRLEAVLTNTLGSSSEAQKSMQMITDFASKTPFAVDELTESYVKLTNQGFKPTKDELTSLGDLASSTGKGFDQLAEGIIDAQTGEFERLKEFGIRAQKEGDKVTFTFKGVKKQVDFTSKSITDYITGLGQAQGVSGAMAAISETLEGKISNLGDSYDQAVLSLDSGSGVISKAFIGVSDSLTEMLNGITAINNSDLSWWKQLALLTNPVAQNIATIQNDMNTLVKSSADMSSLKANTEKNLNVLNIALEDGALSLEEYTKAVVKLKTISRNTGGDLIPKVEGGGSGGDIINTVKSIKNEIKSLTQQMTEEVPAGSAAFKVLQSKLWNLQGTLKEILSPTREVVKELQKVKALKIDFDQLNPKDEDIEKFDVWAFSVKRFGGTFAKVMTEAQVSAQDASDNLTAILQPVADHLENFRMVLAESFGTAIGEALAGLDGAEIGKGFLNSMAGWLKQLGVLMIAQGLAMEKLAASMAAGPFGAPLAIGGGIALIAAATAIQAHLSGGGKEVKGLAKGGLAFGASLAMVGEGRGTSLSNPEVIAPLDKLAGFMPGGGNEGGGFIASTSVSGRDLNIIIERQNKFEKF